MDTPASDSTFTNPGTCVASAVLHSAATRLGEHLSGATVRHGITAEHALMRALDLRCKLEQLVVVPALRETDTVPFAALQAIEQELIELRERIKSARPAADTPNMTSNVIVTLIGEFMTHFDRMDTLLGHPASVTAMDAFGLAPEIEAWTQRWINEITTTGDIEDEEQDPVGTPPR